MMFFTQVCVFIIYSILYNYVHIHHDEQQLTELFQQPGN